MSSLLLPLGLLATFGAIALVVVATQLSVADRRRAVHLLEAQVGAAPAADLWEKELSRPFWERVARPFGQAIGSGARRLTPVGARDRIARKIMLAGSPAGWDVERV